MSLIHIGRGNHRFLAMIKPQMSYNPGHTKLTTNNKSCRWKGNKFRIPQKNEDIMERIQKFAL